MDYYEETSTGTTPYEILSLAWEEAAGGKDELIRFRYALPDFAEDKSLDVWWPRVENSLLYLLNRTALLRYFSDLKRLIRSRTDFNFDPASDPPTPQRSGSWRWRRLCVGTFFHAYRFGAVSSPNFWEALREPEEKDIPTRREIPIFPSSENDRLRQYASPFKGLRRTEFSKKKAVENWLNLARKLYRQWYSDFQRYYTLLNPNDIKAPRYRLGPSLGIGPQQRVFLVSDNEGENRQERVVKWDPRTKYSIQNWTLAKNTGMRMIDWSGDYRFSPEIATLLTERLHPLDSTDQPYEIFSQCLSQLETLHRGGLCHSDIKTDNILRRNLGEYFFIDFDNVSQKPLEFAPGSLDREVYSSFWVSQIFSKFQPNPTSYRYDLQELFYAMVEQQRTVLSAKRRRDGVEVKVDEMPVKEFVSQQAETSLQEIVEHTHTAQIPSDTYLSEVYPMIVGLPERLPFNEIDYSRIAKFLEAGQSKETEEVGSIQLRLCANCAAITRSVDYPLADGTIACGIRCAVLAGSETHFKLASRLRKYYH